jgi:RNA polymerase sigma factor (sigma-70 family)
MNAGRGRVFTMTENQIVRQLHGIAGNLVVDPDLQKDLMQEMFLHLVRIQTTEPGQTLSWCLKSCEFHARNYLRQDRRIDLLKPAGNETSRDDNNRRVYAAFPSSASVNPIEIQGEVITNEIANLILPLLSDRQQQVLFLLMKGCGVRQAARELGVTHPAVIKHRKKIARIAHKLLQESTGIVAAVRE